MSFSEAKRTRTDSEGPPLYKNSKEHLTISDFNLGREFFLNSISTSTPTSTQTQSSKKRFGSSSIQDSSEKPNKILKKLERENFMSSEQIKKLETIIDTLKKDNMKLRAQLEKSEYQRSGFSNMIQKINEESKQKAETIKKLNEHIKKLETQLLKGSLHHNMYEENKKQRDRIQQLEDQLEEKSDTIMDISERLVQASKETERYKQAAEVNFIEIQEHAPDCKNYKFEDFIQFAETREGLECLESENNQLQEMLYENRGTIENLTQENEQYSTQIQNLNIEIDSYKQALQESHQEKNELHKKIESLDEDNKELQEMIDHFKLREDEFLSKQNHDSHKIDEAKAHLEDSNKEHRKLMQDFEKMIKENTELKQANLEMAEVTSNLSERIEQIQHERDEIIQKANEHVIKASNELKEKVLKDKNNIIEQLQQKMKGFEQELKESMDKNNKLEQNCVRYQELLDMSYSFIQGMEQKVCNSNSDEQATKKLKVEIHRIIEGCIKQMLEQSAH